MFHFTCNHGRLTAGNHQRTRRQDPPLCQKSPSVTSTASRHWYFYSSYNTSPVIRSPMNLVYIRLLRVRIRTHQIETAVNGPAVSRTDAKPRTLTVHQSPGLILTHPSSRQTSVPWMKDARSGKSSYHALNMLSDRGRSLPDSRYPGGFGWSDWMLGQTCSHASSCTPAANRELRRQDDR